MCPLPPLNPISPHPCFPAPLPPPLCLAVHAPTPLTPPLSAPPPRSHTLRSCHGVLFDSGVQLDVDLCEERIKLSRNRSTSAGLIMSLPAAGGAVLPEIEEEKRLVTSKLRQWIVDSTSDITSQAAQAYATQLYDHNIPSLPKLLKKLHKDPGLLYQLGGFDEDDLEEIMAALRKEDPALPPVPSVLHQAASSEATSLSHLFAVMKAQGAHSESEGPDGGRVLSNVVAALTGQDPIPSSIR